MLEVRTRACCHLAHLRRESGSAEMANVSAFPTCATLPWHRHFPPDTSPGFLAACPTSILPPLMHAPPQKQTLLCLLEAHLLSSAAFRSQACPALPSKDKRMRAMETTLSPSIPDVVFHVCVIF